MSNRKYNWNTGDEIPEKERRKRRLKEKARRRAFAKNR